jgi:hypothetical protein
MTSLPVSGEARTMDGQPTASSVGAGGFESRSTKIRRSINQGSHAERLHHSQCDAGVAICRRKTKRFRNLDLRPVASRECGQPLVEPREPAAWPICETAFGNRNGREACWTTSRPQSFFARGKPPAPASAPTPLKGSFVHDTAVGATNDDLCMDRGGQSDQRHSKLRYGLPRMRCVRTTSRFP